MSIFDSILGNHGGGSPDIANLAAKIGLSPEVTEQAIAALGVAHQQPGDTVAQASAKSGVDAGTMSQIVQHIGGEGSLGAFAEMVASNPAAQGILGRLDRDGDGSVIDDLGGAAKGLFGRG